MAKSSSLLKLEVRGNGRTYKATARLINLWPEADPWDPSRGVLELDLEMVRPEEESGSKFPPGLRRYRLADPFCAGLLLADQINFLTRQIKAKKPVILVEPPGRKCGCGRQTSTPFCGSCGQQQYISSGAKCEEGEHAKILGQARHCPFCGESIGQWAEMGRIGPKP